MTIIIIYTIPCLYCGRKNTYFVRCNVLFLINNDGKIDEDNDTSDHNSTNINEDKNHSYYNIHYYHDNDDNNKTALTLIVSVLINRVASVREGKEKLYAFDFIQ